MLDDPGEETLSEDTEMDPISWYHLALLPYQHRRLFPILLGVELDGVWNSESTQEILHPLTIAPKTDDPIHTLEVDLDMERH